MPKTKKQLIFVMVMLRNVRVFHQLEQPHPSLSKFIEIENLWFICVPMHAHAVSVYYVWHGQT